MKKVNYILIIGIFFIVISILMFLFLREEVTPTCTNSITCGNAINYFDSLGMYVYLYSSCTDHCETNGGNITFSVPNQNFVIFVWLGVLSIILWSIIQVRLFILRYLGNN